MVQTNCLDLIYFKKGRGLHKIKQYKFAIRIYPKVQNLRFLDIICQKKMSIDELKIDGLSISKNSNQKLLNKNF